MKLPDVNIWLALTLSGHSYHAVAKDWFDTQTSSEEVFFCRLTKQSLMRLLTTRAVLLPYGIDPLSNKESWEIVDSFLTDDRISMANEPSGIDERWKLWATPDTASPKLWMDAWLAAFAHQSGFQLVTLDKAFKQFKGLDATIIRI
ncbi:MAG: TA system VapC family ribonuclease toxin [Verrucomicrobiota bacterium]